MSSFYQPVDLCDGFVTVYPVGTYVGSYGWFGVFIAFSDLCID